jgi:acyl-CoA reductase-like NAD-dependent aldehyde dehydrogenase
MSIREPLGVVAVITPFNVPLIKTTRLVANALAVRAFGALGSRPGSAAGPASGE